MDVPSLSLARVLTHSGALIGKTLTLELEEGLNLIESVSWLSDIHAVVDDDVGVVGAVGFVDDNIVLLVLEDWLLHALSKV